ncbi:iron-sulfur cluster carrier protein ApbC [Alkalimonas collagenimarina]|uniref:Iron-sulfur cluster carrier protein n=1 Tax=Alkalimonas collagenimarina TaxID=400390 RepID=A0ABT9H1M1_9GAMM|nr:iron-sulfur cluster carrier protein ApbC [Alkalimonas collagenimarina]MDP4537216.1 iron-sulfur cluster carrier protein ApbC [Alkalimonas collagenimarina]
MFNWFAQKTKKSSSEPAHQSEPTTASAQGKAQIYKPEAAGAEPTSYAFQRVKHVILVASGKGGVGKSTTAVNLATALVAEGAKTGLLDADIYGPSIPMMLGLAKSQAASGDGKTMQPQQAAGLSVQSIGFLVSPDKATVWRGPMASQALLQLIHETNWPELDYLIVDMPPGTGDIQLTLSQKLAVTGAVIVTTPQDVALSDAQKAIVMFNQVQIPVLGLVENMSYHQCSACGHQEAIFGRDGGVELAARYQLPVLAQLPLQTRLRECSDLGKPLFLSEDPADDALCLLYQQMAQHLIKQVQLLAVTSVPEIVFSDD